MTEREGTQQVRLNGLKLRAAVRAAETPGAGAVVKDSLVAQLGLDRVFGLDLRSVGPSPPPATMPSPASAPEAEAEAEGAP